MVMIAQEDLYTVRSSVLRVLFVATGTGVSHQVSMCCREVLVDVCVDVRYGLLRIGICTTDAIGAFRAVLSCKVFCVWR